MSLTTPNLEQLAQSHVQSHQNPITGQHTSPPGFDINNCRSLYVGNLNENVTDELLCEIFSTIGMIEGCKLIKDKTTGKSAGYGFVDYFDHSTAAVALQQLNGRRIYGSDVKVNWAFAGGHREDTSSHYHIFVGDLSPEIDDRALYNAFSAFGSISDARVMWDQNTGRSRGYGFVAFRKKEDAEQALQEMNGEWLGSRAIRCNWANQKSTAQKMEQGGMPGLPSSSSSASSSARPSDFQIILNQTAPTNTTVYVGNLPPDIQDQTLRERFSEFGSIEEIRIQKDKGFAFVRYQTHESAAHAISTVNGTTLAGRVVKCSWGRDRSQMGLTGSVPSMPVMYSSPVTSGIPSPYYAASMSPVASQAMYNPQMATAYSGMASPQQQYYPNTVPGYDPNYAAMYSQYYPNNQNFAYYNSPH